MPLGYDYVATQDLRINNVPAFHTGQLVPDATASAQGWIATGQVVPVGSVVPGPTGNVPVSPTAPDPVVFPIWADSTTSPPTLRGWNGTAWVTYVNAVSSVNGHTGTVVLTATDVGSIPTAQKGAASGVAQLDSSGKLLAAELPALAINQTFVVASQAAMLALAGDVGDTAVRTDTSTTFILAALPASTLANWTQLLSPASPVSSVAGRTGAVTLSVGDVTNAVATTDSRLSDARTPVAHKTSHQSGGSDALSLDASQIGTGVIPIARLATGTPTGSKFIRDDGTLVVPPTGGGGVSGPIRITANSGEFYLPMGVNAAGTNNAIGTLALSPVWIPVACTAVTLAVNVSGAGATSVGRLGLYSPDTTGRPGALLLDAGTVALSAGGVRTITISQALPVGIVWVTAVVQVATASLVSVSLTNLAGVPLLSGVTMTTLTAVPNPFIHATTAGGSTAATVSGALPSTLTLGLSTSATNAPLVGIGI